MTNQEGRLWLVEKAAQSIQTCVFYFCSEFIIYCIGKYNKTRSTSWPILLLFRKGKSVNHAHIKHLVWATRAKLWSAVSSQLLMRVAWKQLRTWRLIGVCTSVRSARRWMDTLHIQDNEAMLILDHIGAISTGMESCDRSMRMFYVSAIIDLLVFNKFIFNWFPSNWCEYEFTGYIVWQLQTWHLPVSVFVCVCVKSFMCYVAVQCVQKALCSLTDPPPPSPLPLRLCHSSSLFFPLTCWLPSLVLPSVFHPLPLHLPSYPFPEAWDLWEHPLPWLWLLLPHSSYWWPWIFHPGWKKKKDLYIFSKKRQKKVGEMNKNVSAEKVTERWEGEIWQREDGGKPMWIREATLFWHNYFDHYWISIILYRSPAPWIKKSEVATKKKSCLNLEFFHMFQSLSFCPLLEEKG